MKEEFIATDAYGARPSFFNRHVAWSAIVAGLVVALVCQILLTMLGVSIGAATIEPLKENNPAEGLGVGAGIWWFVTGLVSLFVGAFVAGRLSGVSRKKTGALHGFLMWCSATALTFMVAGTVMGGMFGTGFSAISQPENRRELMNELEKRTDQMGIGDQSRARTDTYYDEANRTGSDVDERVSPDNPYGTRDANQPNQYGARTSDSTAGGAGSVYNDPNRTGGNTNLLDDNDPATVGATGEVKDADERPVIGSQEEAQARQAGEKVADTASKAALMGLLVLLIGAGVCTWAGSKGAPHDYVATREHDARVPTGAVPGEPVRG